MIVLQGQELLTSNMMVFPMALMGKKIPWWSLPLNWIVVLFGNLAGSLFFGAILVKYSGILSTEPFESAVRAFAIHKAKDPAWHQIFLRSIGCNWLVCIAIWQATGARDTVSKIVAIWIPIWVFVACGFDHVVANMFSIPLGIMFGADLSVAEYIRKSFLAAFFGNIVGALLVGLPAVYFFLREPEPNPASKAEAGEVYAGDRAKARFEHTSERSSDGSLRTSRL
ncbi:Formate/nitrite transporter-domain-containing protein [Pterulicium gracile]|uniref:Formate/nitrite transporter-domain-containing protein n=1 Tax=Pterulicium gracile TaxID=1884261 RepID=A0A5C3QQZ6_9AGAR|nr:Formate/nitrite transporter-domain-containing protein [Pterula gracilis]